MAGPWEKYAEPEASGPWAKYAPQAEQPTAIKAAQAPQAPKPNPVQQVLGNLGAGAVRGAGSIGATLLAPIDYATDYIKGDRGKNLSSLISGVELPSRNAERRAAMDAALQSLGFDTDSASYGAGKLGGEIAGTMGMGGAIANTAARIPGVASRAPAVLDAIRTAGMSAGGMTGKAGLAVRTAGAGVTGGAAAGLVNPEDAAMGAGIGAAMPGALQLSGKLGASAVRAMRPNVNNPALADKAINQYGIPLGVADISRSRGTKAVRSVLNDAPFVGGIGERQGEAVQEGFNRAVGRTFGADAPKLTPQVVDAAKARMGAEFDRLWNGNVLRVDGPLVQQLADLRTQAAKLPRSEGASVDAEVMDILSKVVTDQAGNPVIPGEAANKFQQYLRRRAESSAGLRNELGDMRQSIIQAFNRSIDPADAAALTTNRNQYKAFKTVEPILRKAEAGVAGRETGDVAAGLLPGAVQQSYRGGLAGSPFEDLSQIGSQYLADRVARTGGGPRAAVQNLAIGGGLTYGAMSNPLALASIPAAAGAQVMLGAPSVAKRAVKNALSPRQPLNALQLQQLEQIILRSSPVAVSADR